MLSGQFVQIIETLLLTIWHCRFEKKTIEDIQHNFIINRLLFLLHVVTKKNERKTKEVFIDFFLAINEGLMAHNDISIQYRQF